MPELLRVGLVGCGHIGTLVSRMVRDGFGCTVLAVDPALDEAALAERGARKVDLPTLLAESDVVSIHCPLTRDTRGMFGAAQFAAMKHGATFVTTARGSIHDEAALLAALEAGRLHGFGADVLEVEPCRPDNRLLQRPEVILSPHLAASTEEGLARMARIAAQNILDVLDGRPDPAMMVNPELAR